MICRFEQGALRHELTPVDNRFITEYLPEAPGLSVKVYLFGLMQCYHPALRENSIADEFGIAEDAVIAAFSYWQNLGLVRVTATDPLTVEYATISASETRDTVQKKYGSLVNSINTLTAPRQFGMRELKHVYDWIELYDLSEGAVLALISYCMEKKQNCPVGYMSSVAEAWSLAGVRTQEEAMNYIADADVRAHGANTILKSWHLRRPPTEDEMARYNRWINDWGFTKDAIDQVLPRLSKSAAPSFDKLDDMLRELYEQGKASAAAVLKDDAETRAKKDFAKEIFLRAGKAEQPSLSQCNQLAMYVDELHLPVALIELAADASKGANEPFGRMKKLLNDWHTAGIDTVEGARARLDAGKTTQKPGKPAENSSYSNEELRQYEIDLNGDA